MANLYEGKGVLSTAGYVCHSLAVQGRHEGWHRSVFHSPYTKLSLHALMAKATMCVVNL